MVIDVRPTTAARGARRGACRTASSVRSRTSRCSWRTAPSSPGSSTESVQGDAWRVHVELSRDRGRTWQKVAVDNGGFNAIQPTILQPRRRPAAAALPQQGDARADEPGRRTAAAPGAALATSGLFAVNSGSDAVTLQDGRHLLVYNYRDSAGRGAGQLPPRDAGRHRRRAERRAGALAAGGVGRHGRRRLDAGRHARRRAQPPRLRLPGDHPDPRRQGPRQLYVQSREDQARGARSRPRSDRAASSRRRGDAEVGGDGRGRSSGKRGSEPALAASAHTLL